MPLGHASAQRRAGQSLVRRMANARALIGSPAAVRVDGYLARLPMLSDTGTLRARTRDNTFTCITEQLVAVPVGDGTPVIAYFDDQLSQPAGRYKVARGGRVDNLEAGTTLLELELETA